MSEAKYSIVRRLDRGLDYDVTKNVIRQKLITRNIMYSMTTGNWGDKRRGSTCRTGVVQVSQEQYFNNNIPRYAAV